MRRGPVKAMRVEARERPRPVEGPLEQQRRLEQEHRAQERRRAVRFAAGQAHDAGDLLLLLDVLGLEPEEGRP